MKFEAYQRRFDDSVLLICTDLERPRGFRIAEKCWPGMFVRTKHGFDPIVEMIPESHNFFGDAEEIKNPGWVFGYIDGGKEAAEKICLDLVRRLDEYLGE